MPRAVTALRGVADLVEVAHSLSHELYRESLIGYAAAIALETLLTSHDLGSRAVDSLGLGKSQRHQCQAATESAMCRNIKTLFNFDPPATDEEIRAASIQFVRKLSGFTKPSKANEEAFERAVDDTARVAHRLVDSLVTGTPARDRELESARARERNARRFA